MEHLYRTFAGDILCEVGIPDRRKRDVIIILSGLPAIPKGQSLCKRLMAEGFIVFYPRYRGTWESKGRFLEKSPVEDVKAVLKVIRRGKFRELFGFTTVEFNPRRVFLWGSSFGGYVGLAAMKELQEVTKGVFFAPAISMARLGSNPPEEEHGHHRRFLEQAWPNVYRFEKAGYRRLVTDSLIEDNEKGLAKLSGKELLIYHSADDEVVSVKQSASFVKRARSQGLQVGFHRLRTRGHNIKPTPAELRQIVAFLQK